MYALYKDGNMISKPCSTQDECEIEAMTRGFVVRLPRVVEHILSDGVSIRDLNPVVKT